MAGQVGMGGMGGMGRQMGQQYGDQGAPMWGSGVLPMGGQMAPPQGQMGVLGGTHGRCPPWMPGCQGGGGGYGGGYAASMPMYGGSRPTLQAQLPAAPRPASPPGSTSLNDGSWMR